MYLLYSTQPAAGDEDELFQARVKEEPLSEQQQQSGAEGGREEDGEREREGWEREGGRK